MCGTNYINFIHFPSTIETHYQHNPITVTIISILMIIVSCDSPPPLFNGSLCVAVCPESARDGPQGRLRPQALQKASARLLTPRHTPSMSTSWFLLINLNIQNAHGAHGWGALNGMSAILGVPENGKQRSWCSWRVCLGKSLVSNAVVAQNVTQKPSKHDRKHCF